MEKIILKAIEGGYQINPAIWKESIMMDPLFWQALGKACGWKNFCTYCGTIHEDDSERIKDDGCPSSQQPLWIHYGTEFHEINLTEGWEKAIAWLEDLIN